LVERLRCGRTVAAMRVLLVSILVLLVPAADASAAWMLPVDGRVAGRFRVGPDPFAADQRRGVDLAATPGGRVVAPCPGRVAFAGAVPRFGRGVSVRCGGLTATVFGLRGGLPRPGAVVRRGEVIGRVGSRGRVRLGARVTADRFAYRDPLALVGSGAPGRVPLVGPSPRPRRRPPAPVVARRVATPRAAPVVARRVATPRAAPALAGTPALAWVGLGLVAAALPGGALAWRVRRSRAPLAWRATPTPGVARALPRPYAEEPHRQRRVVGDRVAPAPE
jgi:hypothetical protein